MTNEERIKNMTTDELSEFWQNLMKAQIMELHHFVLGGDALLPARIVSKCGLLKITFGVSLMKKRVMTNLEKFS